MRAQHQEALQRANEIRYWRADLKRGLDSGENIELALGLLLAADERLATVPVGDFIEWFPGVGPVKARKVMKETFHWMATGTSLRPLGKLDLQTSLRLAIAIRRQCGCRAEGEMAA